MNVANFFPGWHARVDGKEVDILLANSLFRAVPLPPGDHIVDFWYAPDAIALGIQVTAVAALVALGSLVAAFFGARRRRPTVEERRAARLAKLGINAEALRAPQSLPE